MTVDHKKFQKTAQERHAKLRSRYLNRRTPNVKPAHKAWATMRRRKEAAENLTPEVLSAVTKGWTLTSVKRLNAAHLANLTRGSYDRFLEVFDL